MGETEGMQEDSMPTCKDSAVVVTHTMVTTSSHRHTGRNSSNAAF